MQGIPGNSRNQLRAISGLHSLRGRLPALRPVVLRAVMWAVRQPAPQAEERAEEPVQSGVVVGPAEEVEQRRTAHGKGCNIVGNTGVVVLLFLRFRLPYGSL